MKVLECQIVRDILTVAEGLEKLEALRDKAESGTAMYVDTRLNSRTEGDSFMLLLVLVADADGCDRAEITQFVLKHLREQHAEASDLQRFVPQVVLYAYRNFPHKRRHSFCELHEPDSEEMKPVGLYGIGL